MKSFAIAAALALFAAQRSCTSPPSPSPALPPDAIDAPVATITCGVERWPVKVGSDVGPGPMPFAITTIAELDSIPKPAQFPVATRLPGAESTIYELRDVALEHSKLEADGDVHLELEDQSTGTTLIAEIPDPACVPVGSRWREAIAQARADFGPKLIAATIVSVRGVGFFDVPHGQHGAAPNAIELHPVIAICFGKGCAL